MPVIGAHVDLHLIHMGTLQPWIETQPTRGTGGRQRSTNICSWFAAILKLAARRWRDDNGLTWLAHGARDRVLG
jgi:hypothetical protein